MNENVNALKSSIKDIDKQIEVIDAKIKKYDIQDSVSIWLSNILNNYLCKQMSLVSVEFLVNKYKNGWLSSAP